MDGTRPGTNHYVVGDLHILPGMKRRDGGGNDEKNKLFLRHQTKSFFLVDFEGQLLHYVNNKRERGGKNEQK